MQVSERLAQLTKTPAGAEEGGRVLRVLHGALAGGHCVRGRGVAAGAQQGSRLGGALASVDETGVTFASEFKCDL